MAKAKRVDVLIAATPNEVGTLARMTDVLASSGINILHLCAYVKEDKGYFMVITSDNKKAEGLIRTAGYEVSQAQALEIEFESKPGTLAPIAKRLGDSGIDIEYIYGTSADGKKVVGIVSTDDNDKALNLINR